MKNALVFAMVFMKQPLLSLLWKKFNHIATNRIIEISIVRTLCFSLGNFSNIYSTIRFHSYYFVPHVILLCCGQGLRLNL